jgi:hypothetical protein
LLANQDLFLVPFTATLGFRTISCLSRSVSTSRDDGTSSSMTGFWAMRLGCASITEVLAGTLKDCAPTPLGIVASDWDPNFLRSFTAQKDPTAPACVLSYLRTLRYPMPPKGAHTGAIGGCQLITKTKCRLRPVSTGSQPYPDYPVGSQRTLACSESQMRRPLYAVCMASKSPTAAKTLI